MYLYLSCSGKKMNGLQDGAKVPAITLYTGALFKAGVAVSEKFGYPVRILSAKYGWVDPEALISDYDQKMGKPFLGPWPNEPGFYLGGPLYFKNSPEHMIPLIPPGRIGEMINYTRCYESGTSRETLFARHAIGKPRGIIQTIYELLKAGRYTKEGLYLALCKEHGESSSMRRTLTQQLCNNVMGRQKGCRVRRDDGVYWITSESDFYANKKKKKGP